MKSILSLKITGQRPDAAFTLIEMVGVLSIIALLAALLYPKVANALNDAKVNSTVGSYQNLLVATTSHYANYNGFNSLFGTPLAVPIAAFDTTVLLPEGYLDKPFSVGIGSGSCVQCVTGANCNNGNGYFLNGNTNMNAIGNMQIVVEIVITNVTPVDAWAVSQSLDGPPQVTGPAGTFSQGRVGYSSGMLFMFVDGR